MGHFKKKGLMFLQTVKLPGEDVQAAIDTNNQTISYLQQQIEAYQNELNTIQ